MFIDENDILNPSYYNEQKALACLLVADVCFLNTINVGTEDKPDWSTVVYVNANDTFAYACADAESVSNSDGEEDSEIIALYKLWKEHSFWGPVKWLCIKRNMKPLRQIKERMIKDNYWDETLEALPKNYCEMVFSNKLEFLKNLKDKGYHRRLSGSTAIGDFLVCDCCSDKTDLKFGYESNYPHNPDIGLCSSCQYYLGKMYGDDDK